ncbi:MAG TPA: non-homologous end-joining DNA ligase [Polyangia bacterium]|nr:non-homologous end-joining DNA ligase [Polyangia bacterium]
MHEPAESVAVTHPEKVLFPESGITKGDLCGYYADVAPVMLPHVRQRPVTMERYPAGIDKKGFIQKDVSKGFPAWLERVEVARRDEKTGGAVHYPLANDARSLVWLANQNSVTPHVWTARAPHLDHADLCVFDLDPPEDGADHLGDAALCVRDLLAELGLPSFVKTSGAKGFHIVVALQPETEFGDVFRFSRGAGAVLVKRRPDLFTQEFIKSDRGGRIFVDTGRNAPGATFAAVYAVRAKPGAPVSAPCTWDEIATGAVSPRTFTLKTMAGRLSAAGDLWSAMLDARHALRQPLALLDQLLTPEDWKEAAAASTRRPVSRKRPRRGD